MKKIANEFIGAAKSNPDKASAILRKAATSFMGMALDPKNARLSQELHDVAMDFAQAASRQRQPTMQDFNDLLQETAQAYGEVGDDPMDLIARRREIHEERTPVHPGTVSIAPGTFNEDATLGRSAIIKYQPTPEEMAIGIAQSQTVAFWQGVKKEAQALTVDCALVSPAPPGTADDAAMAPLSVRAYGIAEYGSDGNRTSVTFDIALGKRFTVVGNYFSLLVGCDPPAAGSPTQQVSVGASMGTFGAPSQAPICRSLYLDEFSGESDLLPIPLKAISLLALQTDMLAGETADILFFAYGGGLNPIGRAFYQQGANAAFPVQQLSDQFFVKVVSHALAPRNFRLVFQLSM